MKLVLLDYDSPWIRQASIMMYLVAITTISTPYFLLIPQHKIMITKKFKLHQVYQVRRKKRLPLHSRIERVDD